MTTEDERCAEERKLRRIDEAFIAGDLDALRAAVDDPGVIPNGLMPITVGSCLVYAIYSSPLPFIRTLLELGADPNAPADDGFPPLIAALSCSRTVEGATRRTDVDEIIRLHEDNGCLVFNPHRYTLEEGGMKRTDRGQLAFKKEADPKGLLNPGKMIAWNDPDFDFDSGRQWLFEGLHPLGPAA